MRLLRTVEELEKSMNRPQGIEEGLIAFWPIDAIEKFAPDGVDDSISLKDYPGFKICYRRLVFEQWRLGFINLPTMLLLLWRGRGIK